jgi:ubiquitin carboxyl-terminal hydrolase 7
MEDPTPPAAGADTEVEASMDISRPESTASSDSLMCVPKDDISLCVDEEIGRRVVHLQCNDVSTYQVGEKFEGKVFLVNKVPFRLLAYPGGQKPSADRVRLPSLFLELVAQDDFNPDSDFECFVVFTLGAVNSDPQLSFAKFASCRYVNVNQTWGFPNLFANIKNWFVPMNGFLVEDTLNFVAEVVVVDGGDRRWGVYRHYDSKAKTGMVGITNQGATCYMNSVLETLFHTNELRRAIYRMPTTGDDSATSVPLGLQRVFYRLQTSGEAVETGELTKSFGWGSIDSFMQHDVQEFFRVLMDNMEEKMKGTSVEGTVPRLFEGTMKSYIRCKNIEFESSRMETFQDIQLNVKGQNHLINSFKDYTAVEAMDGDNKYMAEGHGLQDADKGIIFVTFPPVLHLHLKRFEYSYELDDFYKVNDRFEFPEHIDLTEFLAAPMAVPATYTLHAVLVHSGFLQGGHYTAYVRPKLDGDWFNFDDDQVERVTAKQAIDANFGQTEGARYRVVSNAYMLSYIRDSDWATVQAPCGDSDVLDEVRDRFL